jgi:hypothetical protein
MTEFETNPVGTGKRIEELETKLAKAVDALMFIDSKICWEINTSNYGHGEVCNMNSDWCEIGNMATNTLAELKGQDDE